MSCKSIKNSEIHHLLVVPVVENDPPAAYLHTQAAEGAYNETRFLVKSVIQDGSLVVEIGERQFVLRTSELVRSIGKKFLADEI